MIHDFFNLHKITRDDILRYVLRNTNFCPIEQQIDPLYFEVFEECILNSHTKEIIDQDQEFVFFQKELSKLRRLAPNMKKSEILSLCEELESFAPKTIKV
jgi:hypothetical protein